jgi:dipeptidase D
VHETDAVRVIETAQQLGLEAKADQLGNVVVKKPASPGKEGVRSVALQGHLDMVWEKNKDKVHDFFKDPIELVRDGNYLKANGTTLGADNGIAVATNLAIMEDRSLVHGPLEFVFTIDEETGLTGASELAEGALKSKYFLNLDSEEEGALFIGCAGGLNTIGRKRVEWLPASSGEGWRIKISGLQGGHSGIDIHKGRGNAVRILGRTIQAVLDRLPAAVAAVSGGSKRNAIAREASAVLVVEKALEQELRSAVAAAEEQMRAELGAFDPGLRITVESAPRPERVMAPDDASLVAGMLASLPHGVLAMSPDIPELVQTSTNLAIVSTRDGEIIIEGSQRSAIESSKRAAGRQTSTLLRLGGFETEHSGGYPGWKPEPESEIVRKSKAAHKEILGTEPELFAIHAGLECGLIGEKHPGMQMISFGPQLESVHSPSERVKISSVEPFWRFLTGLLERL